MVSLLRSRLLFLFLVLVAVLAFAIPAVRANDGAPLPGTVVGIKTAVLYPATMLRGTGTTYTASPRIIGDEDLSRTRFYNAADLFVTAVVSGTATVTATAQLSADGRSWTNATYKTTKSDGTEQEHTYQLVLGSSTTGLLRIALAGEYTRVKLDYSAVLSPTGAITPTILLTLRNN